jgi:DNA-3-methyladenine glycosylase
MLSPPFFARNVLDVARDLIGTILLVDGVGGRIVEIEAYDPQDPASHSYGGRTARNASMFGPPGHAYVYRSYGIHWCLNFVCGAEPLGSAVLIRAIEPTSGLDAMRARRSLEDERRLCAGPGRLCQALGLSRAQDGLPLDRPPFRIDDCPGGVEVSVGPRIGITRGAEAPWRFGLSGSLFVSRPFGPPPASSAGAAPASVRPVSVRGRRPQRHGPG